MYLGHLRAPAHNETFQGPRRKNRFVHSYCFLMSHQLCPLDLFRLLTTNLAIGRTQPQKRHGGVQRKDRRNSIL
ncbi:unnamed protein product [Dicrocoelium dendriticum]|nr:unnamed protein product [Dicrocoelium dendriticum]